MAGSGVICVFSRRRHTAWLLLAAGLIAVLAGCAQRLAPTAPDSRLDAARDVVHGVEIPDPYRWLEDQESAETRAWIGAQNRYTDRVLGDYSGRQQLEQAAARLLEIESVQQPVVRNGRYFFSKRAAHQDQFVLYMQDGLDAAEQVLLDPHSWSDDHTTSLSVMNISWDGTLVAYGVRENGEDELTVKVLDVDSGTTLDDVLPKARYFGVSIIPDNSGFFYTHHGQEGSRIRFHALGTDPATDPLVFGEGYGPGQIIFPSLSDNGRYLVIHVLHGTGSKQTEVHLKDITSEAPPVVIVDDIEARFFGVMAGDRLLVQTNWEAPNSRVLAVDPAAPDRSHWREIIAERPDASIQASFAGLGVSPVGGRLFVRYLKDVHSQVTIFDPDGTEVGQIAFDTIGTLGNVSGRWDDSEAFFQFQSFHIPATIYRYDVTTGTREVWHRTEVPVDSESFEVKQVWYPSRDGTRVPMFLVHNRGLEMDGSHPTLLTGYGGFNASRTPAFSTQAAVWVEQGGVYAVANLRGGGEFGEKWHQAGMLDKKQNVFDDFIAAAEFLVAEGYTSNSKLAIMGGSNGGLLVGAAMTQRPELFGAVVCAYPLLDMVRYHRFLVGRFWVPEYGSAEDPDQFAYLHAYSPYHQVRHDVDYPAVLFITGDGDTRVAPLHARKMTALMQAGDGTSRPVLLRYHTDAGHAGGRPVSEQIQDLAESFTFLLAQLDETS